MEDLDLRCIPHVHGVYTEMGTKIIRYTHLYYLIKVVDLLDTVSIAVGIFLKVD